VCVCELVCVCTYICIPHIQVVFAKAEQRLALYLVLVLSITQHFSTGTKYYSTLYIQVVFAKAEQRLALEGGHKDAPELKPGGRYEKKPGEYAMHKFAYYICFK